MVQKYGGSSVATPQLIEHVAARVVETRKKGNGVVVVVSAMGETTDDLIELTRHITAHPPEREMDMLLSTGEQVSSALLCIAIHKLGQKAVSFTGGQAGIKTDSAYTKARILNIDGEKILSELLRGKVVVVAGFQGVCKGNEITTLGRGGSDTTAVALAAALHAAACEIYTDVDGVYTADPHVVPDARLLARISYEEMLEFASLGAKVMHPRAVETAKLYDVPLVVKHSRKKESQGTWIVGESMEKERNVSGVACDGHVAMVTMISVPDRPGIAAKIFGGLGGAHVNVDMISQVVKHGNVNDITFTVSAGDLKKALVVAEKCAKELKAEKVAYDSEMAKVSVVGVGMISTPGIAGKMFKALGEKKINIEMISTSEIRVSCLIDRKQANDAVRALHKMFGLGTKKGKGKGTEKRR